MQLITVSEAAKRVGVGRGAIYYAIKVSKIKAQRESGNILIDAEQLVSLKPRVVTGLGKFASQLSSTEEYFARKAEEKALER